MAPGSGDLNIESTIRNIRIPGKPIDSRWDMHCQSGFISSISPCQDDSPSRFAIPSMCHPHIHLDKCFLLSHAKYEDLEIERGDFAEALELTNKAKSRFDHDDLIERGATLLEESIGFGVTHMRAFVEVDATVGMKCLDAGIALKNMFQDRCYIQICVFAQDPIFSYEDGGNAMTSLLEEAVNKPGVDAFGSTPYVEDGGDPEKQILNIKFAIGLAQKHKLHLDFHIDYNLDHTKKSFVLEALDLLRTMSWPSDEKSPDFRTVVFGHCTRLTLFAAREWEDLVQRVGELPVSFIGLPSSDIYMMRKPSSDAGGEERVRGTLQIPHIIKKYGLNAAIGINNVGNAFTPQGSCDPLSLASLGVGIYQAGTNKDAEILLNCVSNRAKAAIGLHPFLSREVEISVGIPANFVVFGSEEQNLKTRSFRKRNTVQDVIYDAGRERRTTYFNGVIVGRLG